MEVTKVNKQTILATPRGGEYDWDVVDEYDPLWPNDYEKMIKEKRDKEREKNRERDDRKRDDRKRGRNNRQPVEDSPPAKSGFGGRPTNSDDDEPPTPSNQPSRSGAAIAPPPSLQDDSVTINPEILKGNSGAISVPYGSSSVAAKIMAKYGFKDGQGLGKQEQGMSMALQVEKTSKRGGRIIHEKEIKDLVMPPPAIPSPILAAPADMKPEPSITEILKAPSKVVLLRVSLAYK